MNHVDIIIIGAGLSGLTAAHSLEQKGLHVLVLEARHEVGGRTRTKVLNNVYFDMGGQYIGKRHVSMQHLCKTLGLHLAVSRARKPVTWFLGNKRHVGYLPPLSMADVLKCFFIFFKLNFISHNIDFKRPWQSKKASAYDQISFGSWLEKQKVSNTLYELFSGIIGGFATLPITDISFLHVLWWIARSGSILKALEDGSNMTVTEGAQSISQALAEKLGEKVLLNNTVTGIEQDDESVRVYTDTGSFTAKYAIVTVPIGILDQIHFHPAMPENLQEMINTVDASKASSVVALLKSKKETFSDITVNHSVFPLAWRDELKLKGITLTDLQEAEYAHALSSCFTGQQNSVEKWAIENWGSNPFAKGTYIVFKPGQLTKYGSLLRIPHGRVFFAGAERSSWVNNMEGAVESGQQVAGQIMSIF